MAFPERIVASPLLVTMVKAKQLGCKSGVGFFVYGEEAGETCVPGLNPLLAARIAKWAVAGTAKTQTPQAVADRLLLPMVCEAARILEEGRVAGPEEIDAGSVLGLGFPPSRGGLLEWADTLGASEIVRRLRSLDANAVRYQPPRLLADLASRKVGFFQ
jgi:3-hydroxyacyl-CoA dehydrogenase